MVMFIPLDPNPLQKNINKKQRKHGGPLRENPGLKVKLLVGYIKNPTELKGAVRE